MKFLLVLVAFVAFVSAELQLTDEQKATVKANAGACIQQEGITKEQATALRQGNFDNADANVKCFANCFLEKTGFFVDGQRKPDVVLAKLGPIVGNDKLKAIQDKCASVTGTDKCDTAFQLYQCYYKNNLEI